MRCPVCNKDFESRTPRITCSNECACKYNHWDKTLKKQTRICPVCNKEFKLSERITCGKECHYKLHRRKKSIFKHICIVCKKEFETLGFSARKTCSKECRYKYAAIKKNTKVVVKCCICSKEVSRTPGQLNRTDCTKIYCSKKCCYKGRKELFKGENNPSYIDGRSKNKRCYRGDDWEDIRKSVYQRDGFCCRICKNKCISKSVLINSKMPDGRKVIQCHHRDGYNDDKDNDMSKLFTLCNSCHTLIHKNKEFYNEHIGKLS